MFSVADGIVAWFGDGGAAAPRLPSVARSAGRGRISMAGNDAGLRSHRDMVDVLTPVWHQDGLRMHGENERPNFTEESIAGKIPYNLHEDDSASGRGPHSTDTTLVRLELLVSIHTQ